MKEWLPAIFALAFMLQSCVKNSPIIGNPFKDDKLLLSKVTGKDTGFAFNFFEYTRDSVPDGNRAVWDYSAIYSYGSGRQAWGGYKPMQEVSFANGGSYFLPASPGGSWNITYNNNGLPDKIIDNSIPGVDQGYWQLYYNNKLQVIKTGFAFSTSAGPTEFEFYGYDDHDNLTDLVYGKYVDTPFYKLTFSYDEQDNLIQWQYLFTNGYVNSAANTNSLQSVSSVANLPKSKGLMSSPIFEAIKKFATNSGNNGKQNLPADLSFKIPPTRLVGDSNVIYENYITSTITNDGKINPYHQQGRLLFYISSRNYSADITANFSQLQKSNPVSIQYIQNPDFGPADPMTSNYAYTYNILGYPVTIHEATSDPSGIWFGSNFSYTQNRQIEYIKNN
jgi:hypothetical protein